jgi:transglutaminase-like putative cysteine protease
MMHAYAVDGQYQPAVIRATRAALGSIGPGAPAWRKADAVWRWVHGNIRFVPDEEWLAASGLRQDAELLQLPELLLTTRAGDCDCFTILLCSMLAAAGVDWRIVTICADPEDPTRWSHVYAVAVLEDGSELPMDASHGRFPGWQARGWFQRAEWVA